jgi:site-specific DNA-methyltransferase (adenine-specific)
MMTNDFDLRSGDWRVTMADVECDTLLTDPPYSQRTHEGQRSTYGDDGPRLCLTYDGIDQAYTQAFVEAWLPRVRSWWVIFSDHIGARWWLDAMAGVGLYTFAPVVWAKRGATPRFTGDGPASQVEYIAVARPARAGFQGWGSLPGWYEASTVKYRPGVPGVFHGLTGAKPETLMRALVRDYSRPGWTIADPHAGSGTTLVAARAEGRRCIGSEMDHDTHAMATKRLAEPRTREMFASGAA